jgi:hypothetical protein
VRDKKATGDDDAPGDVIKLLGKESQNSDITDHQHIWNWKVATGFHSNYNECLTKKADTYKMQ